jgi:DNA-binding NtrC family response regulator
MDGVGLLRESKNRFPRTEVIIVTGYGTIYNAVEATKLGAFNYLIKPVEPSDLLMNVDRIRQRRHLLCQNPENHRFHSLIGRSLAMRRIFQTIPRIARMNNSVLIQGESGVGKELVAQAIHLSSRRATRKFIPIDCGALSDSLLESELFGHKQGSFTGSTSDRMGMIETANGGTLLLDEVGNASHYLQSRLLRVIEEKKVRRVGDNSMIPVDVRIISASNVRLADMVEQGNFREDLYFRLSGFVIDIPPLRERREDIPLLAQYFLEQNTRQYDFAPTSFSPEALETLMIYPWHGNVRELRTVVERAIAFAESPVVQKKDLSFDRPFSAQPANPLLSDRTNGDSMLSIPFYTAVEDFERRYLSELLENVGGNISQASQLSGASRKTIREKGKKYGLL